MKKKFLVLIIIGVCSICTGVCFSACGSPSTEPEYVTLKYEKSRYVSSTDETWTSGELKTYNFEMKYNVVFEPGRKVKKQCFVRF